MCTWILPWYIRALEETFDCAIYVFTEEDESVEMLRPRGKLFSAKYNWYQDCVLIYLHPADDHNKFPQCELIVRTKAGEKVVEKTKATILPPQFITRHEKELTDKMYNTYFLTYRTLQVDVDA